MEELLEIFGLDSCIENPLLYNKYEEKRKSEANKLRLVWNIDNVGNDYCINAMFKSGNL